MKPLESRLQALKILANAIRHLNKTPSYPGDYLALHVLASKARDIAPSYPVLTMVKESGEEEIMTVREAIQLLS